MFISQLYTGSISDKQIVYRSGFLDLLSRKKEVSEIFEGDSTMADKGFDIEGDLQKIGLQLNTPPFLKEKPQFDESHKNTEHRQQLHIEFMCKGPFEKLGVFFFSTVDSQSAHWEQ